MAGRWVMRATLSHKCDLVRSALVREFVNGIWFSRLHLGSGSYGTERLVKMYPATGC